MTSSSRDLLLERPTFSGMTVPGKTTMLRMGRIGRRWGRTVRCPLPPPVRMTVPSGDRSMIWDSPMVSRPWEYWVWCPGGLDRGLNGAGRHLGQLDPEHAVAVRGADAFAVDV